jgi:hypothetical protein
VRGKAIFLALVAGLIMLCATAVAFAHEGELRVPGTKGSDELTMGDGSNRVYARAGNDMVDGGGGNDRLRGGRGDDTLLGGGGDDRLKGGQDDDYLDGGEGDDRINARGDGRDGDEVVCGAGEDTVLLGRNDEVVVGAEASELPDGEEAGDDGCEHVKYPKGEEPREEDACAANSSGCDDESVDGGCIARFVPRCDDPEILKPEPEEAVEELEPDTP